MPGFLSAYFPRLWTKRLFLAKQPVTWFGGWPQPRPSLWLLALSGLRSLLRQTPWLRWMEL